MAMPKNVEAEYLPDILSVLGFNSPPIDRESLRDIYRRASSLAVLLCNFHLHSLHSEDGLQHSTSLLMETRISIVYVWSSFKVLTSQKYHKNREKSLAVTSAHQPSQWARYAQLSQPVSGC